MPQKEVNPDERSGLAHKLSSAVADLVVASEGVIRSGDPDLIFPGEVLVLPEVQPHG